MLTGHSQAPPRSRDRKAVVSVNDLTQVTMKLRCRRWPETNPLRIRPRPQGQGRGRSTKDKIRRYKLRVARKEKEQARRQVRESEDNIALLRAHLRDAEAAVQACPFPP